MTSGRPSLEAKAAVQADEDRPEPPEDMPEDQVVVWERIVFGLPPDWFRPETLDLLENYCRHQCRCRAVSTKLNELARADRAAGLGPSAQFITMLHEELAQTKAMIELATKMRITQQSTYDASKRKPKQTPALWGGRKAA